MLDFIARAYFAIAGISWVYIMLRIGWDEAHPEKAEERKKTMPAVYEMWDESGAFWKLVSIAVLAMLWPFVIISFIPTKEDS